MIDKLYCCACLVAVLRPHAAQPQPTVRWFDESADPCWSEEPLGATMAALILALERTQATVYLPNFGPIGIYAVTLVNGSAYCDVHLTEYHERVHQRPYPSSLTARAYPSRWGMGG